MYILLCQEQKRDITVMNCGYKQHPYVVGHIARFLIYRYGRASVPACVGFEISRDRRATGCITLLVDSQY
jgi:hypothetical protein